MERHSRIVAVVQQVLMVLARRRKLRKSDASETLIKVSDKEVQVYPVRMPDSPLREPPTSFCACFLILRGPTAHFQFQYAYTSVSNPLKCSVHDFMLRVLRPLQNLSSFSSLRRLSWICIG